MIVFGRYFANYTTSITGQGLLCLSKAPIEISYMEKYVFLEDMPEQKHLIFEWDVESGTSDQTG